MKISNKLKRILLIIISLVLVISVIFFIGVRNKLENFSEEVSSIKIQHIDLSTLDDGRYIGEYYVNDMVGASVEVTINSNKISNIEFIDHKYGKGKKAEKIIEIVLKEQSIEVDSISGATGSSRVILKAIENALDY